MVGILAPAGRRPAEVGRAFGQQHDRHECGPGPLGPALFAGLTVATPCASFERKRLFQADYNSPRYLHSHMACLDFRRYSLASTALIRLIATQACFSRSGCGSRFCWFAVSLYRLRAGGAERSVPSHRRHAAGFSHRAQFVSWSLRHCFLCGRPSLRGLENNITPPSPFPFQMSTIAALQSLAN